MSRRSAARSQYTRRLDALTVDHTNGSGPTLGRSSRWDRARIDKCPSHEGVPHETSLLYQHTLSKDVRILAIAVQAMASCGWFRPITRFPPDPNKTMQCQVRKLSHKPDGCIVIDCKFQIPTYTFKSLGDKLYVGWTHWAWERWTGDHCGERSSKRRSRLPPPLHFFYLFFCMWSSRCCAVWCLCPLHSMLSGRAALLHACSICMRMENPVVTATNARSKEDLVAQHSTGRNLSM